MRRLVLCALCLAGCGAGSQDASSIPLDARLVAGAVEPVVMSGLMLGSVYEDEVGDEQSYVANSACPADMKLVQGSYCPSIVQECINLDTKVHNANGYVRCLEFAQAKCLTPDEKRIPMKFCIDTYEWPNNKGEKPAKMVSWFDMKRNCESVGKRLCEDREWTLACEGPEILAYPYGNKRAASRCNIDKPQMPWFDAGKMPMTMELAEKLDQSVPSGSMSCVSPYGVEDLTGNEDEWVINTEAGASLEHYPWKSGLVGGAWVLGHRNRCNTRRPMGAETNAHGPTTVFYELGGRCCKSMSDS
jgi:sulfatase-modifying factor enzyme 1